MASLIVAGILLITIGVAVWYIVKAKKSGVKCIGCPAGGSCFGNCGGDSTSDCGCGCHSDTEQKSKKSGVCTRRVRLLIFWGKMNEKDKKYNDKH